ncbi:MAG: DNA polymerase III subunit alpha [Alphaproteobacteria bacterium]|nr:DNA polymerase III subunit alpha [Alphaproteobacteria bacterium]
MQQEDIDILGKDFVHLRCQSSYSLLASAIKIPELVKLAKLNNMESVALSDYANLFGSLEFSMEATKAGIMPIHGLIVNVLFREEDVFNEANYGEMLFLAKDLPGYQNLLKLGSYPYIKNSRKNKEYITLKDIEECREGIICLSGYSDGPIGKLLLENNVSAASDLSAKFQEIFGNRFYFEIFRHKEAKELKIELPYLEIGSNLKIPLAATNKVVFANIEMHDAHDVLMCIAAGVVKEDTNRKFVSNQCYFKTKEEMAQLFADLPASIINSANIAKRCAVRAEESPPLLPVFTEEESEADLLRKLAQEGLNKRLEHKFSLDKKYDEAEVREKYFARLEYELEVVLSMNFAGYFLIVSDFIKWSKENGINVGPGRGSGAGSIIAWSLLITDLDPIRFGLLFERFLNPERISMPDFDIDFCQERREEVINYVRSKYGDDRVAQIITFGKLQAKAVIKDVARVLGLRYEISDYLTELVPFNAVNPVTLDVAIKDVAELKMAYQGNGLYNNKKDNELIKQVLDTALILEGLNRHCSVHAAGIVISGKRLIEMLPLYKDSSGDMNIIQYSMKHAEAAGLVKFDFLGLQTLTVISKCMELLRANGIELDLSKITLKDPKTYKMLSKGSSVGVFQFESVGMKDTLRKLQPDRIEDLMALGALYRPGPMDNIPTYIACKHGKQKPDYLHPLLKDLLEETYGVIVYQEQVLEIAKILAGYSLGSADLLRRAMGKKIKSEMEAQEKMFIDGAKCNGIEEDQAKYIFSSVEKFAGYGFNRAHAASYGMISYYTAYLKANHPLEFLVACLNLDINDYDQIRLFREEARNNGINFLSPDVNSSTAYFSIKKNANAIEYGFGGIRNITTNFGLEVEKSRSQRGIFKSVTDFVERMSGKLLTKKVLESLIKSGAFDSINSNRQQLLLNVPNLMSHSARHAQDTQTKQASLFGCMSNITTKDDLHYIDDATDSEKAFMELDTLGLFVKHHPLEIYRAEYKEFSILLIENLYQDVKYGSSRIRISGVIVKKDARMSARGRFITLLLSDFTSNYDVTVFSEEVLKEYSHLLSVKTSVIVECDVYKDIGGIRLTGLKFYNADSFFADGINNISVKTDSDKDLSFVLDILEKRQVLDREERVVNIVHKIRNFSLMMSFKSRHELTKEDYNQIKNFLQ